MAEKHQLEYFLLRYVPNGARGDCVNIGLVMTEAGLDSGGFADIYFTQDWKRTRCIQPDTDEEVLRSLAAEIENRFANANDRAMLLQELMDGESNCIQISPVLQCVTEDPVQQMKYFSQTLVDFTESIGAPREISAPRKTGVAWIRSVMKKGFETSGFWRLLDKNLPVAMDTVPGDSLTFDFAYGLKKEVKLFQAVSLAESPQRAVDFAFHYYAIAPRMAQRTGRTPILTAVVEDQYDARNQKVAMAIDLLTKENAKIARVSQMPAVVEAARLELRGEGRM